MERNRDRYKLGIFGGTYEGRLLAEFCRKERIPFAVSVATTYGSQLLGEDTDSGRVSTGRMDAQEMDRWIRQQKITAVVDATHPFAEEASRQIRSACALAHVEYQRLRRAWLKEETVSAWQEADICWVSSFKEAAEVLNRELRRYPERKALLTTGSRELSWFAAEPSLLSRIFVRVLPSVEAIQACIDSGFSGKQIIAMQGPFSCEFNQAILHSVQASYLVTKESGQAGGFEEKVQAALTCGCQVIAVKRPGEEGEGKSFGEIKKWLSGWKEAEECPREIALVGIGMGGLEQITWEGLEALLRADALIGAQRMVESGKRICRDFLSKAGIEDSSLLLQNKDKVQSWIVPEDKQECITWKNEEMLSWVKHHPKVNYPAVLFSGDIGFYSGAKGMLELLKEQLSGSAKAGDEKNKEDLPYRVRLIPGISSLSSMAARIGRAWDGVETVSFHGREETVDWAFSDGKERFFLLDGTERLHQICRCLLEHGQEEAKVWVGEYLSYPAENMISGNPKDLLKIEFGKLLAAWVIPG